MTKHREFYFVRLTPERLETQRYGLYEIQTPRVHDDELPHSRLMPVWPDFEHTTDKTGARTGTRVKGKLWPFQVHSKNRNYPGYHFAVPNPGYKPEHALAQALASFLKSPVCLFELHGMNPSTTDAPYPARSEV